jgi:glycosyltransferase involved in cell wall biosynthesis
MAAGELLPMRIAQIAPLHEAVPPKLYGGTERVVSYLTEELVALGHDVTLFASGDSVTSARLEAVWPRALRLDPAIRDPIAPHMLLMETVRRQADDFDVLHFHMDYWPFSLFSRQKTPFVTTLHGRLDLAELQPVFNTFPHVPVVSISDSQRRPLPQANFVGTVLHGLPENLLTPQGDQRSGKQDYLAFLGRICPEKRPDRAIRIARAIGVPLKIAAKVDRADQEYFETVIKPMLSGGGVELVGEINDRQKPAFLSGALGLLMPIDWPEPFGLVMIEAMACGTPVIAMNRGSVPEVIEDGVTGFIVEDEVGAISAAQRLHVLDRARVRRVFEERFTARRMAEDYLKLYRSLGAATRPALRVIAGGD